MVEKKVFFLLKIYIFVSLTVYIITNINFFCVVLLQLHFLHPFPIISTYYAGLTASISVHSAFSQSRSRHSVIWRTELKQCQHIHPGRDEFQLLDDHFVTVMEGHSCILCFPASHPIHKNIKLDPSTVEKILNTNELFLFLWSYHTYFYNNLIFKTV